MKRIAMSKASKPLRDYAKDLNGDCLVLTSGKKRVAALLDLENEDADAEIMTLSKSRKLKAILDRAREEIRAGKAISLQDIKAEFGIK